MTRYVFTDPEAEALGAAFDAGSPHLPDERWAAVRVALDRPPPAGPGAVEIDLDGDAERDLRDGFAAGWGDLADDEGHAAMADALAGVARILDVAPAAAYGR